MRFGEERWDARAHAARSLKAFGRTRAILAFLIVVQWIAVFVFAMSAQHNGWLFYNGGDSTWYYTTSWVLSQGHLPQTVVGYGYSLLGAFVPSLVGPNLIAALPAIVVIQVAVLLPVSLLCIYGIAARMVGRSLAIVAASLWIFVPYLAIPLFATRYHERYVDQFLPQALGLTPLSDFPSMVFLLVAAYFAIRAIDGEQWTDGLLSGLAAGFAFGIKPANLLFVPAVPVALAISRRWRQLPAYAVGTIPSLLALVVWKRRGLGEVPGLAYPEARVAAAPGGPPKSVAEPFRQYVQLDWHHLALNLDFMRIEFWSVRLLEWLLVAGAVAALRRSPARAALLGLWFGAYFFLKGAAPAARVTDASLFRLIMPAYPAGFLLVATIPTLVPRVGSRIIADARRAGRSQRGKPRSLISAGIALAVLGVAPIFFFLAAPRVQDDRAVKVPGANLFVPMNEHFRLTVVRTRKGPLLRWNPPYSGSSHVFYLIFRASGSNGLTCVPVPRGAADCNLQMDPIGRTRGVTWRPKRVAAAFTYRVGLSANWRDSLKLGDVVMISAPVTLGPTAPPVRVDVASYLGMTCSTRHVRTPQPGAAKYYVCFANRASGRAGLGFPPGTEVCYSAAGGREPVLVGARLPGSVTYGEFVPTCNEASAAYTAAVHAHRVVFVGPISSALPPVPPMPAPNASVTVSPYHGMSCGTANPEDDARLYACKVTASARAAGLGFDLGTVVCLGVSRGTAPTILSATYPGGNSYGTVSPECTRAESLYEEALQAGRTTPGPPL
ncbi:MAG TPA: glycosyltransferase family 39 protein [Gaiellaceae bacterium]|jgi:hypothetical protein